MPPLLVGAANFLVGLGSSSLYVDEGLSWLIASASLADVLDGVRSIEISPPAHYYGLHEIIGRVSDSEVAMRLPSALAGIGLVAATFWVAGRVAGPRAAAISAWLVALSPLVMEYAQQGRAYIFAMLGCVVVAGSLLEAEHASERQRARRRWLLAAALAAVVAFWTHYTAALAIVPLFALTAGRGVLDRREALLGGVAVGLCWLPLAPLVLEQLGKGHEQGIANIARLTPGNLVKIVGTPFDGRYGANELTVFAAVGAAAVTAAALLVAVPRVGRQLPLLRTVILPVAFAPIAVVIAVTAVGPDVLITRYTAVAAPFVAVVIGAMVSLLSLRRSAPILAVAGASALAASLAAHTEAGFYSNTRSATLAIASDAGPRDAVVVTGAATLPGGFQYYASEAGLELPVASAGTPSAARFGGERRPLWLWYDPPPPPGSVDAGLRALEYRRTHTHAFDAAEDLLLVRAVPIEPRPR